jgi:predicted transcriptional regulator
MRYAVCVKRTTIMLPDDLDARLRHEARKRGVSIADVARRAIEEQLPEPGQSGTSSFFAIGAGGPSDAAGRVQDFVGPAIGRRHPVS